MKNLLILLLVVAVAVAAFLVGRRSQPAEAVVAEATPVAAPASADAGDNHANDPSAQPVRTFRGPDGVARMITYDEASPPDNTDPEQVRAALLEDMKNHPANITRAYDLGAEQIADILAGKQPMPDYMLPKPAPVK